MEATAMEIWNTFLRLTNLPEVDDDEDDDSGSDGMWISVMM